MIKKIYLNWRLITLQYCSGFCHTLMWISHGCTCVPHAEPPPPPPSRSQPSGLSQCTSPEHPSHALNLDWRSISHMVIVILFCHSKSSVKFAESKCLASIVLERIKKETCSLGIFLGVGLTWKMGSAWRSLNHQQMFRESGKVWSCGPVREVTSKPQPQTFLFSLLTSHSLSPSPHPPCLF